MSKNWKRKINEINYNKFIWEKGNKILIDFIVELIKVLSCVDAVFKLLHVEVVRKATDRERKKKKKKYIYIYIYIYIYG